MERQESLANLSIAGRIKLTTLDIAQKLVDNIILTTSGRGIICSTVAHVRLSTVVNGIVTLTKGHRLMHIIAISTLGRRRAVARGWSMVHGCSLMVIITLRTRFWHGTVPTLVVLLGSTEKNRVICVCLDMLLQVLGTLERFTTEVTLVRFKGNVHTNMRSNVVTLYSSCTAVGPTTGKVEIVGGLSANMFFANMFK